MMGSPISQDKSNRRTPITVYRGDVPLPSGSEYKSGETLLVKLEGRSGQYCMEVRLSVLALPPSLLPSLPPSLSPLEAQRLFSSPFSLEK